MDCTFVVRDVGDAQFLGAAARELHARGRRVGWVALGQAANALLGRDAVLQKLALPLDTVARTTRLGAEAMAFGGGAGHRVGFARGDAKRLAKRLAAPLVVTGVVSRAQEELIGVLRNQKRAGRTPYIVGVYDSLALNRHCFLFDDASAGLVHPERAGIAASTPPGPAAAGAAGAKAALIGATPSFAAQLDELWVPLTGLVAGACALAHMLPKRVQAVGHPPTAQVLERLATLEGQRQAVRLRLGLGARDTLVFYAAGRDRPGEHHAARSLELLLRGAEHAPPLPKGRRVVVVGLHPASTGRLERDLLMLIDPTVEVRLLRTVPDEASGTAPRRETSAKGFSTEELIVAADVIATFNSIVASQAALLGPSSKVPRKVLFVDANPERDAFMVAEAGLASEASTIGGVAQALGAQSPANDKAQASGAARAVLDDLRLSHGLADRLEALFPTPAPAL